jgi:hypothetical protein
MDDTIQRQTYTVAEAARILGISRALAYRVLPTIDLEGRRVVSRQVIDRMLAPDAESNGGGRPPDATVSGRPSSRASARAEVIAGRAP